ncbi:MAG: hypothetical protein HYU66_28380, partial [Armatimonadetes bacterium]|nr:hypothetical protein [Armatimonadota bacterium]
PERFGELRFGARPWPTQVACRFTSGRQGRFDLAWSPAGKAPELRVDGRPSDGGFTLAGEGDQTVVLEALWEGIVIYRLPLAVAVPPLDAALADGRTGGGHPASVVAPLRGRDLTAETRSSKVQSSLPRTLVMMLQGSRCGANGSVRRGSAMCPVRSGLAVWVTEGEIELGGQHKARPFLVIAEVEGERLFGFPITSTGEGRWIGEGCFAVLTEPRHVRPDVVEAIVGDFGATLPGILLELHWSFALVRWASDHVRSWPPELLARTRADYGDDAVDRWGPELPARWGVGRLAAAAGKHGVELVRRFGPDLLDVHGAARLRRAARKYGDAIVCRYGPRGPTGPSVAP